MRILILLLCFLATPALAQDYKTILDLPEGATLISLSASERVEIQQDLLVAQLRYETEDTNPRALQDAINKKMKAALDKAQSAKNVKASTQQYHVYEYDRNQGKRGLPVDTVWRGQQGLMLKSKAADDLLELVGDLQEIGLSMQGLSYQVSPELLEETREGLLEAALKKLTSKAERTAQALGKKSAELKTVNVDMGGFYQPQPRMEMMAMKSAGAMDMAAPVAAAGESEISLNVSAQALLK